MLTEKKIIKRDVVEMMCTELLVPQEHLLRKIDAAVDFNRIYEIVGELYVLATLKRTTKNQTGGKIEEEKEKKENRKEGAQIYSGIQGTDGGTI